MDNKTKKISGVYNWIRMSNFIKYLDQNNLNSQTVANNIDKLLSLNNIEDCNDELKLRFDELKHVILNIICQEDYYG